MTIRREEQDSLPPPETPRSHQEDTPRDWPLPRPPGIPGELARTLPPDEQLDPAAPLDIRVTRLEVRDARREREVAGLISGQQTMDVQVQECLATLQTLTNQLLGIKTTARQYESDRPKYIRELGMRAQQDSLHDTQHAQARQELGAVKRSITWRDHVAKSAWHGIAGGIIFSAGFAWNELKPIALEALHRLLGF